MSSSTSTNSSTRRGRGRPPNASRRAAILAKTLDASGSAVSASVQQQSSSSEEGVSPARPSYNSRSESITRAAASTNTTSPTLPAPPAFARAAAAVATRSSSPVPLPPALFSGTFEVPSATPHTSPPPNRVTSPNRASASTSAAPTTTVYLSPPQQVMSVANPPSVTVSDADYQRVATTVKIDPPSTSGSWFNSTPINNNTNASFNYSQQLPIQQQQQHVYYSGNNHHTHAPPLPGGYSGGFVGRQQLPPQYHQAPPPLPQPYYTQQHPQSHHYQPHNHPHQQQRNMPPIATANSPSTARLINAPSRSPNRHHQVQPQQTAAAQSRISTSTYFRAPTFTPQRPSAAFREASALKTTGPSRQQSVTATRFSYDTMTPEHQAEARKKLFDKFLILQRSFPAWNIPIPSEESSLDKMFDLYESYVKQITIHSNSTQYKIFLVIMFVGIEFAASRFAIDLSGYAEMQIRSMHRYEGVLLELGEKYMAEGGGEWPVEARIVLLAVIQAGVFFVAKYVEKWTGSKGMSKMVHSIMDNMMENVPAALSGGEPAKTVDAQGFPMAPGTESAIQAVDEDDDVSAAIAAASGGGGGGGLTAPTVDLGNMLSGLFGGNGAGAAPLASAAASLLGAAAGGGGGNGGGGLDVANLVGTAMKFIGSTSPSFDSPNLNQKTSPSSKPAPTSPNTIAGKTSPTTTSRTSPTSPGNKQSPSRVPRKAPVFTE